VNAVLILQDLDAVTSDPNEAALGTSSLSNHCTGALEAAAR
jgi:hypothetical protein